MTEEFRKIPSLGNRYEISKDGVVRNARNGYVKAYTLTNSGYYAIQVKIQNRTTCRYIHRLIAEVYIPNPNNLPEINHKNEIKTDNRIENLEWCTSEYNKNYGTHNARVSATRKLKYANGEYTNMIDAASKGRHIAAYGNTIFYLVEDNKYFDYAIDAARYLKETYNLTATESSIESTITRIARGKQQTTYGKHFKLVDRNTLHRGQ